MSNIVAIVGRPNVGKSTLFNRLIGERQAIVDATSGVTRDRHYGRSEWIGYEFSVIDTGGYLMGSDDIFEEEIRKQVQLAIDEADVILFLVDVTEGATPMDDDVADMLRRQKKPVILVANKVDTHQKSHEVSDFYSLGLGEIYGISSVNGLGTGELLDEVVTHFESKTESETTAEKDDLPKICVVGRPNVGKSSFINALLGIDRNIVTDIAGTTRDSLYTRYNAFGFDFNLVDTAGLRKKSKVSENIEFYSVMRSIRTIESSDVVILMIDATAGFEAQDLNIFSLAERNRKGIVILVNKWDLVEKTNQTHLEVEALIREKIAPFSDVPIIFTSVTTKQRIFKALEVAHEVYRNYFQEITTSKLNDYFQPILEHNPPPAHKGKLVKIKYVTKLPTRFPGFVFFANLPQYIKDSYKRFLENKLREHYNYTGVPIEIFIRKK
ncbi:MAG: ribosome biogenesis GTPase Der [Bacteroidetes bacterium]|nr:ribosome biogenesis GTPase Der [Bacteroidota bacterium]